MVSSIDDLVELIESSNRIVVLTGAGISVAAGIPDFRSERGLYQIISKKYPELQDPQEMFDYHVFLENPDIFYSFAKEIYPTEDRSPTFAHRFIAELEKRDKLVRNYTQNIDTLEDLAGISKVFRCHGGFDTARCITCGNKVPGSAIKEELLKCEKPYCQFCSVIRNEDDVTHGLMKPDIVFFHESLPDEFSKYLMVDVEIADLVIVMGSSLQVAPVSSFTKCFPPEVPIVLINMERIYHIGPFTASLLGDCQAICCYLAKKLNWDISDVSKGTDMIKTSDPVFYHPNFEFVFNYKPINEKRSLDYLSNEENLDLAPQQIISKYDSEYGVQYRVLWNRFSSITWEIESCLQTKHPNFFHGLELDTLPNDTMKPEELFPEIFGQDCILPLLPKKKETNAKDADPKKKIKTTESKQPELPVITAPVENTALPKGSEMLVEENAKGESKVKIRKDEDEEEFEPDEKEEEAELDEEEEEEEEAEEEEEEEEEQEENGSYYIVEKIMDKKITRGKVFYRVRWEGYGSADDTWEPVENVRHLKSTINEFEEQYAQTTKSRKSK